MLLKICTVLLLIVAVYTGRPKYSPCVDTSDCCKVKDPPKKPQELECVDCPPLGIIGGYNTTYNEFPFVVALLYKKKNKIGGRFKCGASVINSRMILTAAHCFMGKEAPEQHFIVGGHEDYRKGHIKRDVAKFITHKKYNPKTMLNDIALAYLKAAIPIGGIGKVRISSRFPRNINKAKVCGWGATKEDHTKLSRILKCIDFKFFNETKCKYILDSYWHPSLICAGKPGPNVEKIEAASGGDSGGPVIVDGNHQIALVTAGPSAPLDPQTSELYNIYTLVSYHHNWIMDTKEEFWEQHAPATGK